LIAEGRPALSALLKVGQISFDSPTTRAAGAVRELTPLHPTRRLKLERHRQRRDLTARMIDLIAPLGKGQRAGNRLPAEGNKTMLQTSRTRHQPPEVYRRDAARQARSHRDVAHRARVDILDLPTSCGPAQVAEMVIEGEAPRGHKGRGDLLDLSRLARACTICRLRQGADGRRQPNALQRGAASAPRATSGGS
jgi:hypothetical protein